MPIVLMWVKKLFHPTYLPRVECGCDCIRLLVELHYWYLGNNTTA